MVSSRLFTKRCVHINTVPYHHWLTVTVVMVMVTLLKAGHIPDQKEEL